MLYRGHASMPAVTGQTLVVTEGQFIVLEEEEEKQIIMKKTTALHLYSHVTGTPGRERSPGENFEEAEGMGEG